MVPQLVIDHFKQINVKITELGNTARNLNVKLKDLQEEHDSMTKTDIS
jgi:DNA integrity scanning protein DisA with diadenylate cyclase activity